jgi:hypothetical protein
VCKGLVIDKLHRLKYNHNILTGRSCRASYGILCYEPYSRRRHSKTNVPGQIYKNPVNGKRYATKRICWLIERGRPILRDEPICHRFYRTIPRAEIDRLGTSAAMINFVDTIAVSKTRPDRLPTWFYEGDVEKVGNITSKLPLDQLLSSISSSSVNITANAAVKHIKHKKRRNWIWRRFPEYWKVELELRMFAGSAGLRFEIWCGDSRIGETDQIPVNWVYHSARPEVDTLGTEGGTISMREAEVTAEHCVETDWARGLIRRAEGSSDGGSRSSGVGA